MSFTVSSSKLTATPRMSSWAQVHEFLPSDSEKLKLRGHLFAVISTEKKKKSDQKSSQELDSINLGREVIARLHEEYFGKLDTSAFFALKGALSKVISEFSDDLGEIQIAAVTLLSGVAYSAAGGGAQVAIFRNGMLAKILKSDKANISSGSIAGRISNEYVVSASGHPKEADILILGSSSFFEAIPSGVLKASLSERDIKTTVENLAPMVHSDTKNATIGAAFITGFKKAPDVIESIGKKRKDKITSGQDMEGRNIQLATGGIKKRDIRYKFQAILSSLGKKLDERLSKLPERKIFIRDANDEKKVSHKRRVTASIGVILLFLLVVSIFFGIRQKRKTEETERYEPTLIQAQYEFDEAIGLFTLDEKRARELINLSRIKVDQLLAGGIDDPRLVELKDDLDKNQGRILGEYTQEAELFVDLGLLSDGFSGEAQAADENRLYILDKDGKTIVRVSLDTKKSEVFAGPSVIDAPINFAVYSDKVYVVEKEGVYEVGDKKDEVIEDNFSKDVLSEAYAANLYVLDKEKSIIWRYTAGENGFGKAVNWFAEGVQPNLTGVISWSIDGTIWTLNDRGKIYKYSLGNRQNFNVSGVLPPLINPRAIYTNETLDSIYVLEPAEGRVVVFAKTGEFRAQYKSEKAKNAIDLSVSEKTGKIILFTKNKLYSLELRHIEEE